MARWWKPGEPSDSAPPFAMRSNRTFTVEYGTFWTCQSDRPPEYFPSLSASYRELGPGDLDALLTAMQRADPEVIAERFQTGRRCFGFEVDGRIVSFGWMTPGAEETGELERTLSVPAGEAYVWDCGTIPDQRRKGFYSALLNRTLYLLQDEGVPRVWIGASRLNAPSIRGIANAGFRHAIDLTYRRFGKFTWLVLRASPDATQADATAARRILLKPGEWVAGPFAVGWLA